MTHPTPLPAWCECRVWLGRCSACASDHPGGRSTRSDNIEFTLTPSCTHLYLEQYPRGTTCQSVPSLLTLLSTLRVSCLPPPHRRPLPIPVLETCGTWELCVLYRSRLYRFYETLKLTQNLFNHHHHQLTTAIRFSVYISMSFKSSWP